MKNLLQAALLFILACSLLPCGARAQGGTGSIEFVARITPTAARPEPVRQFTFYLLTKSYADVVREVEASDPVPDRDAFIAALKVSEPLKAWLKKHELLDLTSSDLDQILTAEDVTSIPEFLDAYLRANSGGVTRGLPRAKYSKVDREKFPEKYERLHQEFLAALRKFITSNPMSVSGIEVQLDAVNPHRKWSQLQGEHLRRTARFSPEFAQTRYLVAKVDTDLEGRAALVNVPAGNYWISTLGLDAAAGDVRLRWDVPVVVRPGETARLELTNLNAVASQGSAP